MSDIFLEDCEGLSGPVGQVAGSAAGAAAATPWALATGAETAEPVTWPAVMGTAMATGITYDAVKEVVTPEAEHGWSSACHGIDNSIFGPPEPYEAPAPSLDMGWNDPGWNDTSYGSPSSWDQGVSSTSHDVSVADSSSSAAPSSDDGGGG